MEIALMDAPSLLLPFLWEGNSDFFFFFTAMCRIEKEIPDRKNRKEKERKRNKLSSNLKSTYEIIPGLGFWEKGKDNLGQKKWIEPK